MAKEYKNGGDYWGAIIMIMSNWGGEGGGIFIRLGVFNGGGGSARKEQERGGGSNILR